MGKMRLVFKGGPIIARPELVSLYLGPFLETEVDAMQGYLAGLAGYMSGKDNPTGKMPVLRQYGITGATVGAKSVVTNPVDPLPGSPQSSGTWPHLKSPHQLIPLGDQRVLDWIPHSGAFRIWKYDPNNTGSNHDPLPGDPEVSGTWDTIRDGHSLLYLGGDRVLDWQPASGHFRIWKYDPGNTGSNHDPFPGNPAVEGSWDSIRTGHELIYLDGDRVLDWEPASGHFRIWKYDRGNTGSNHDPFPGNPEVEGSWETIRSGHRLVYLGNDRVLDWEPDTGHFRVWKYDRGNTGSNHDPFPGDPQAEGIWSTIHSGHQLISLEDDRVLDWVPATGAFRTWVCKSDVSRNWDAGRLKEAVKVQIANGSLPPFSAHRIFLCFTKTLHFDGYSTVWCGYHDKWDDKEYFAVLPLPQPGDSGCYPGSAAGAISHLQSTTSHETFEASTDPAPFSGWTNDTGEGGDAKCNDVDVPFPFGTVQRFEDNSRGGCAVFIDDPLPDPPLVDHKWKSIVEGQQLIDLGNNRVLDWEPDNGAFRVWQYSAKVKGDGDPFPEQIVGDQWQTIRKGHQLVYLGGNRLLDWQPANGGFKVWTYDPNVTGKKDPLHGPVTAGTWKTIGTGHHLITLDDGHVLDWAPVGAAGQFKVWKQDPAAKGKEDPLPGDPVTQGLWSAIGVGHQLVPLGGNRVLDWEPANGHFRIWKFDPNAKGHADPFPGEPIAEGSWSTIGSGHTLVYLGNDRVLDWEVTGHVRIWSYART